MLDFLDLLLALNKGDHMHGILSLLIERKVNLMRDMLSLLLGKAILMLDMLKLTL